MKKDLIRFLAPMVATFVAWGSVNAAPDYEWAGADTSGGWEVGENWTPTAPAGGPSGSGLEVKISHAFSGGKTINVNGTRLLGRFDIGASGGTGKYLLARGSGGLMNFTAYNGGNAQINQLATSNGDTLSAEIVLSASLDITNASTEGLTLTREIRSETEGGKTLSVLGGDVTFSGAINDGAGTVAISKSGAGNLTLSAASGFSGGLTLAGGTLTFLHNHALGASGNVINLNGGELFASGDRSLTRNYQFHWGGDFSLSGGNLSIGSGSSITLEAEVRVSAATTGSVYTVKTAIGDDGTPRGLTVSGPGLLLLEGDNTYGGGTRVEGRLRLDGSHLNAADYEVGSGGVLSGTGSLSFTEDHGLMVENGGRLVMDTPGEAMNLSRVGSDAAPVLTLEAGAALGVTLGEAFQSGRLDLTGLGNGAVVFGGNVIHLSLADEVLPAVGIYQLLSADADAVYAGLVVQDGVVIGGLSVATLLEGLDSRLLLDEGDLFLELRVVPEPSALALAGVALILLWGVRRKRFQKL